MEDHEALELLLFYCVPRQDTNALAHRMIERFGKLHHLLEATPEEISKHCGVSMNTAVLVSLILPLHRKYATGKWERREKLDTPEVAGAFAGSLFIGETYECVYIICLDVQKRLIYPEMLCRGTLDEVQMYPRTIVEAALKHNAACVIMAHNHPSGLLSASRSDIEATRIVKNALEVIGIELIDHIIVAGDTYLSLSAKKLMNLVY